MKILVFGCGAIGSAFGGFLSRSDHEVCLYGRTWHLAIVKRDGLKVEGLWGRHTFRNFRMFSRFGQLRAAKIPFDLVLLTVKSYDTDRACREIRKISSENTPLVSIQNGLGNIETIHRYFPRRQVLAARVIFGVEISPGSIKITVSADRVLVGDTKGLSITPRVRKLAALFSRCGIEARPVSGIRRHIWAKVIYNCALNPLATILEVHYGALLENELTRLMMTRIVKEAYSVAERERIKLEPGTPEAYRHLLFGKLIPATYDHHPSMLQDLLRRRRTEIDSLNGALCRIAKIHGLEVPVNQLVVTVQIPL